MKRKVFIFAAIAAMTLSLSSCYQNDIDEINSRIDKLEGTTISSIDEQVKAIQNSVTSIEGTANGLSSQLTATNKNVTALQDKAKDLQKYADSLSKSDRDWAKATFATIEQYGEVTGLIEGIKEFVDSNMYLDSLTAVENGLKDWVNLQLEGYITIAEFQAKAAVADSTIQAAIDSAKSELTRNYQAAISKAITENNGVVDGKISAAISAAESKLQSQIDSLKTRVDAIETKVDALINRIQSVVVVPDYTDGSVMLRENEKYSYIRFEVHPESVIDSLINKVPYSKNLFNLKAITTKYPAKANSLIDIPIESVTWDGEFAIVCINNRNAETAIYDAFGYTEKDLTKTDVLKTKRIMALSARLQIVDPVGQTCKTSEFFSVTFGRLYYAKLKNKAFKGINGIDKVEKIVFKYNAPIFIDDNIAEDGDIGYFFSPDKKTMTVFTDDDAIALPDKCDSLFAGFAKCTDFGFNANIVVETTSLKAMFAGCASLESIDLSQFSLNSIPMDSMFVNCSKLSHVKVGFKQFSDVKTNKWLKNVAEKGIFEAPYDFKLPASYNESTVPESWVLVRKGRITPETDDLVCEQKAHRDTIILYGIETTNDYSVEPWDKNPDEKVTCTIEDLEDGTCVAIIDVPADVKKGDEYKFYIVKRLSGHEADGTVINVKIKEDD